MPTKKSPVKKSIVKKSSKSRTAQADQSQALLSGTAVLFAGAATTSLGWIQDRENIQLLLVGFGAALLIFGGAMLGTAIKVNKVTRK